ncbi:MAG TPA: hypothetical protein VGH87_02960 [Polyangiaceae bacterium]
MKAHFVLMLLATACGGGSGGYDDLFGAPVVTTTTPDTIEGLWGGSADVSVATLDYRVVITDGSVTFASRCNFVDGTKETVGVTVAASASSTDVLVKQSASDAAGSGDHACRITATPADLGAQLSGTNLVLSFPNGDSMALVKLSD